MTIKTPKKILLPALFIAAVALVTVGCTTQTNTANAPSTNTNTAAATGNAVTIQNFAFSPGTLTVAPNTTVTWTNKDSAVHRIKSDTFNSADLAQGQSFSFTFITPGTYPYSCAIHPSMTGTIIVQ